MGAKAWLAPGVKLQGETRAAEAKRKKEEAGIAKALDKEASKLVRQTIRESGRLIAEEQKDNYLARLKADVAKLEAKQKAAAGGKSSGTTAPQAEEGKPDARLAAAQEMERREAELEKKRKEHVRALAELAEFKRHARPGFARPDGGLEDRKQSLSAAHPSIYDDPGFWALEAPDRRRLEFMRPDERLHYGFGPYRADAVGDAPVAGFTQEVTIEHKLRHFQCTEAATLPGVVHLSDKIDNARAVQLPDLTQLHDADLPAAQEILDEATYALQDELILYAIEQYGANALLSFVVEGPLPVEDEQLVAQGYLYEIVASGVPALIRPPPLTSRPYLEVTREPLATTHANLPDPPPVKAAASPLFGHLPASPPRTAFRDTYPSAHPPGPSYAQQGEYHYQQPYNISAPWPAAGASRPAHFPSPHRSRFPSTRTTWAPDPLHPGQPTIPPELKELPWGAQMYVKRVRAMQEQEEQEAHERAAMAAPPHRAEGSLRPFLRARKQFSSSNDRAQI
ncbi:hypothetical protein JCM3774_002759 [Rhodotorula dairenensis]